MLKLPPPIWTMIYLALTGGVSWALGWPYIGWPPHHEAVGMAIFFAGCGLAAWAFVLFRLEGTEVDPSSEANRALVVGGPFRFSRNPMYLGLIVAALGMAAFAGYWLMLAAPLAVFLTANYVHIPFEEAKMRRQFGEDFDAYAGKVRRWL
jgi:protein-S-isoprenylcysteine O-methyltransferase Ste14